MAMYPNATHGYMPFVKPAHKRQAAKRSKADKDSMKSKAAEGTKTYKVTMRDRRGFTYTYIIQADASKNLPVLCESRVTAPDGAPSPLLSNSLPNMRSSVRFPLAPPETRSCASLAEGKEDLSKVGDGEKKGLFNSLLQFIKKKTSSKAPVVKTTKTPATKVKRKLKPLPQKKRARTVSALSHLGTIHESPDEDNLGDTTDNLGDTTDNLGDTTDNLGETTDNLGDTDSYSTPESVTSSNESESGEGQESCPCP